MPSFARILRICKAALFAVVLAFVLPSTHVFAECESGFHTQTNPLPTDATSLSSRVYTIGYNYISDPAYNDKFGDCCVKSSVRAGRCNKSEYCDSTLERGSWQTNLLSYKVQGTSYCLARQPNETFEVADNIDTSNKGTECWCQVTGYIPYSSGWITPAKRLTAGYVHSSKTYNSEFDCVSKCPMICADSIALPSISNKVNEMPKNFRQKSYNSLKECLPDNYEYIIRYKNKDEIVDDTQRYRASDASISLKTASELGLSKENYEFIGWRVDEDYCDKVQCDPVVQGNVSNWTGDKILYAQWRKISCAADETDTGTTDKDGNKVCTRQCQSWEEEQFDPFAAGLAGNFKYGLNTVSCQSFHNISGGTTINCPGSVGCQPGIWEGDVRYLKLKGIAVLSTTVPEKISAFNPRTCNSTLGEAYVPIAEEIDIDTSGRQCWCQVTDYAERVFSGPTLWKDYQSISAKYVYAGEVTNRTNIDPLSTCTESCAAVSEYAIELSTDAYVYYDYSSKAISDNLRASIYKSVNKCISKQYDIIYKVNGRTDSTLSPANYKPGYESIVLPTLDLGEGIRFLGWCDGQENCDEPLTGTIKTGTDTNWTGNKTLYAKWVNTEHEVEYLYVAPAPKTRSIPNAVSFKTESVKYNHPLVVLSESPVAGYRVSSLIGDHNTAGDVEDTEYSPGTEFNYETTDDMKFVMNLEKEEYTLTYYCGTGTTYKTTNQEDLQFTYAFNDDFSLKEMSEVCSVAEGYDDSECYWNCTADILKSETWGLTENVSCVAQCELPGTTCDAGYYKNDNDECVQCGANSTTEDDNTATTCTCNTGYTADGTLNGATTSTSGCLAKQEDNNKEPEKPGDQPDPEINTPENPSSETTPVNPVDETLPVITYKNGNTVLSQDNYTVGESVNILTPTTTDSSKIFAGWCVNTPDCDNLRDSIMGGVRTPDWTDDVTLYARWTTNKFQVTTVANTSSFDFKMSAKGTFYIDWGDGTVERVNRASTTEQEYSHNYTNPGLYTVSFGGIATAYNNNTGNIYSKSPISFLTSQKLGGISGSLGALFPTIGDGNTLSKQPRFLKTFADCSNLTGTIPEELFYGVTGTPVADMFEKTFFGCSGLTGSIPPLLFKGISGVAPYLFRETFSGCSGLTGQIPSNLFDTIRGNPAEGMFSYTFKGCSSLTGVQNSEYAIPENLFQHISGAPAYGMFAGTFEGCTDLNGKIPEDLFSGISGKPAEWMFAGTFADCENLTGTIPNDLFKNISGEYASAMYYATFSGCKKLTGSIPYNLFGNLYGAPKSAMFKQTFTNCSGLTGSIPPYLFGRIDGSYTNSMFDATFENCSGLTGQIPPNLFGNLYGAPAEGMFSFTFLNCNKLTGKIPLGLFGSIVGEPAGYPSSNYSATRFMFYRTFAYCTGLTGFVSDDEIENPEAGITYIPKGYMEAIKPYDRSDYWDPDQRSYFGPLTDMFFLTSLANVCPENTYLYYKSPFSEEWDPKVSCEKCPEGTTSPAGSTTFQDCVSDNGTYRIKYIDDDNTYEKTYTSGETQDLDIPENKTKYNFVGWCEGSLTCDTPLTETNSDWSTNKMLYAVWELKSCENGYYMGIDGCTQCPAEYPDSIGTTASSSKDCFCSSESCAPGLGCTDSQCHPQCAEGYHPQSNPFSPRWERCETLTEEFEPDSFWGHGGAGEGTWYANFAENNDFPVIWGNAYCLAEGRDTLPRNATGDCDTYPLPIRETVDTTVSGNFCWCQITQYRKGPWEGVMSRQYTPLNAKYIQIPHSGDCTPHNCAQKCELASLSPTNPLQGNGIGITYKSLRRAFYDSVYSCAPDTYTITYMDDSTNLGKATYIHGSITALSIQTKNCYQFNGWCVGESTCKKPVTKTAPEWIGDKILYAQWSVKADDSCCSAGMTGYPDCNDYLNYNITYNNMSGAVWPENYEVIRKYTMADEDITIPAPSKKGYDFDGWCTNSLLSGTCPQTQTIKKGSLGNKVFYAKWRAKPYTITYVTNNGIETNGGFPVGMVPPTTYSADTIPLNLQYVQPELRPGYKFVGWCDDEELTMCSMPKVISDINGENITLYAKWQAGIYNIEYYDGTTEMTDASWPKTYTYNNTTTLPTPTKTHYIFNGWYDSNNNSITTLPVEGENFEDIKLYAQWTPVVYTLHFFDLVSGKPINTIPQTAVRTYTKDSIDQSNLQLPSLPNSDYLIDLGRAALSLPTRQSTTGWWISSDRVGGTTTEITPALVGIENLYAVSDFSLCKVEDGYTTQGVDSATNLDPTLKASSVNKAYITFSEETNGVATTVTTSVNTTALPELSGNDPQGSWGIRLKYGDNTSYAQIYGTSSCNNISNPTDVAALQSPDIVSGSKCWCKMNKYNYNINGNTTSQTTSDAPWVYLSEYTSNRDCAKKCTIKCLDTLSSGWSNSSTDSEKAKGTAFRTQLFGKNSICKLIDYNISYEFNGGAWSILQNLNNVPYGYTIATTSITLPVPVKDRYTFVAWCEDEALQSCLTNNVFTPNGQKTTKKFYAKWNPEKYAIKYYDSETNEQITNLQPAIYPYGTTTALPTKSDVAAVYNKEHFQLASWHTDSETTDDNIISEISSTETANPKVLYAKWEPATYDIHYYNGETEIQDIRLPSSYTYGVGLVLPDGVIPYYDFEGWYTDPEFDEETKVEVISKTSDGPITLYAKTTSKVHDIEYFDGQTFIDGFDPEYYKYTYGTAKTLPSKEEVEAAYQKANYEFKGWHNNMVFDGNTLITEILAGETDNPKKIYSEWKLIEYTITYHSKDVNLPVVYTVNDTPKGTVSVSDINGSYITQSEIDSSMDYSFDNLLTDDSIPTSHNSDSDISPTKYEYYYNSLDGTYMFGGWYPNTQYNENEKIEQITSEILGTVTDLYAKWDLVACEEGQYLTIDETTDKTVCEGCPTYLGFIQGYPENQSDDSTARALSDYTGMNISSDGYSTLDYCYVECTPDNLEMNCPRNGTCKWARNPTATETWIAYYKENGCGGITVQCNEHYENLYPDYNHCMPETHYITLDCAEGTSGCVDTLYTEYNNPDVYLSFDSYDKERDFTAVNRPGTVVSDKHTVLPVRTNYVFDGYYDQPTSGGTRYINSDGTLTDEGHEVVKEYTDDNNIWYAHWTPESWSVSYYDNTGNGGNLIENNDAFTYTYSYGTGLSSLPNETVMIKDKFEFVGWYNKNGTNQIFSISASDSGPKELYAKWIRIECDEGYSETGEVDTDGNILCEPESFAIKYYDGTQELSDIEPVAYTVGQTINIPMPARKEDLIFTGWCVNSATCDASEVIMHGNQTTTWTSNVDLYAQWTDAKFLVETAATNSFSFYMTAVGTFYVDCGADGTLSGTGVSGNRITRNEAVETLYFCTYSTTTPRTIRFGGTATGYVSVDSKEAAIRFNTDSKTLLTSVSGNLSKIFPYLGTEDGKAPKFYQTFGECTELTSIPDTLFADYTIGTKWMFHNTFFECKKLESIPENLFKNITTGAESMFSQTFGDCYTLTSIPSRLFANITTGAERMFSYTFAGGIKIETIPEDLFASIQTGGEYMFKNTFYYCTSLTSIPSGLFANISNGANGMFDGTFQNCTTLTSIPAELFDSISGNFYDSMFQRTFSGCTSIDGFVDKNGIETSYIPSDYMSKLNSTGYTSGPMANMFSGTAIDETCPTGMVKRNTPFNTDWDPKVSCAPAYTITYVDGENIVKTEVLAIGDSVDLYTLENTEEYNFAGWCETEDTTECTGMTGTHVSWSDDVTLYAKWVEAESEFVCDSNRWLHIGTNDNDKLCLSPTKIGSPSFVFGKGSTRHYLQMTLQPSGSTGIKMNKDSNKKFNVLYKNQIYNVHDASVQP